MKNILFFVIVFFVTCLPTYATLSGTYIISANKPSPYNSVKNAIQYLTEQGADGDVTFTLVDSEYEFFDLTIGIIRGLETANTLTIQAAEGLDVTIHCRSFEIKEIDHVVMKGNNNHQLHFTDDLRADRFCWCYCRRLDLEYCSFEYIDTDSVPEIVHFEGSDELNVSNCTFEGGSYPIAAIGGEACNFTIRNNEFGRKKTGNVVLTSIDPWIVFCGDFRIEDNYFNLANAYVGAALIASSNQNTYFNRNYVSWQGVTDYAVGFELESLGEVRFVQNVVSFNNTKQYPVVRPLGRFMSSKCDILNNTFVSIEFFIPMWLSGYSKADLPAFVFSSPGSSSQVNVKNNIFDFENTTPDWNNFLNFYKFDDPSGDIFKNAVINNNIYYAKGYLQVNFNKNIGFDQWRQNNPKLDAQSKWGAPNFVSATDLHLTQSNGLGSPIPEITTDIEGNPRDPLHPDAGAYEFKTTTITPSITQDGQCQLSAINFSFKDLPAGTWTVNWNFGDGQTGTGTQIQHIFVSNGTYSVTATVSGPKDYVLTKTIEIQHQPTKPTIKISNGK